MQEGSARVEGTGLHPGIQHLNGRFVFTIQHLAESKGDKRKSRSGSLRLSATTSVAILTHPAMDCL